MKKRKKALRTFSRGGDYLSGAKGQKWPAYKTRRRRAVRFLTAERNILNREAVFKEEKERVKQYDETIDFLNALDFSEYAKVCPMCKEPLYAIADVEPACFNGVGDADPYWVGLIHRLRISHCYGCGFTTVDGF